MKSDISWEETVIQLQGRQVRARYCEFETPDECGHAMRDIDMEPECACMFTHLTAPVLESYTTIRGTIAHRCIEPPRTQLWCCDCTLSAYDILEVSQHFGFPSSVTPQLRSNGLDRIHKTLAEAAKECNCQLMQIQPEFIVLTLKCPSSRLTVRILNDVYELNRDIFGVNESILERSDRLANWLSKGIFSIGSV